MSGKVVEPVSEGVVEGPSVGHNVEVVSTEMEVGGSQTSTSDMMSDLVAIIVKFMVVISAPHYTIMSAEQKVGWLLSEVGEVNIPVDTARVRANVTSSLQI